MVQLVDDGLVSSYGEQGYSSMTEYKFESNYKGTQESYLEGKLELLNTFFSQFMLMLGDFDIFTSGDNDKHSQNQRSIKNLLWTYFFLAITFTRWRLLR